MEVTTPFILQFPLIHINLQHLLTISLKLLF